MNQVDKIVESLGKKKNKSIVSNLLSSSQCHICHEILNVPMMLSCGHNYCYMCLKSWFKTNETRSLGCPDCRKSVDTTPVFNLFLDHQLKFILVLAKEKGTDPKWDQTLSEREQDEEIYKNDATKDTLFANVFKNSTLSVVDMDDDGIPRCGNCHWELDPDDMDEDENVCPHCHYRIRNDVTAADSENVMGNSARSIANDLRRRTEEYSEGEYDEIVDDIRRFSDSDLESEGDASEHEQSGNRNTTLHDDEAIDEDANSRSENEDELEEEHDSDLDSFIENDEEDDHEETIESEDDEPSIVSKKRKYVVLDDANSSDQDSDFYEHNDHEGFVSGDSLDDASDHDNGKHAASSDKDEEEEEEAGSKKRRRRAQVVLSDDE